MPISMGRKMYRQYRLNMFKKILLAVCLSILFLANSSYADSLPLGSKLMLVGDSLGVGLGPRFRLLAKEYQYKSVTDSIGGTTTKQWVSWLPQRLKQHNPDLLLVSLGTNDSGFWGKAMIENPESIDKLLQIAKDNGTILFWIGIPIMPEKKLPFATDIDNLIESKSEYYFNSKEFQFQRAEDKIHFTGFGYADWMDEIWTNLLQKGFIINPYSEE